MPNPTELREASKTLKCRCGGEIVIDYGFGKPAFGARLICVKCGHVYFFMPDF